MATNQVLFEKITRHLDAEELAEPLYIKLYNAIAYARENGREKVIADIIAVLDDFEEQERAAAIFARVAEYEDTDAQYSALAQQIHKVKMAYYDRQIADATAQNRFEVLNELAKARNQLNMSKIAL